MITFSYDDGYRNNFTIARPLHLKYNIPATFNIVTDWIKKDHRYSPVMTLQDVYTMQNEGFEIASHTVTHGFDDKYPNHPNGKRFADMTDAEVEWELSESKRQFDEWGIDVKGLALPFGSHANNRNLYHQYEYVRSTRIDEATNSDINDLPVYIYIKKDSNVQDVKDQIDIAINDNKWIIVLLHHVINPDDDIVKNNSIYYWYKDQLEEILQYVANKPKSELLPINTIDALRILGKV